MSNALITVVTGEKIQPASMVKIHAFHAPRLPAQRGMREFFLSGVTKDPAYAGIVAKVGLGLQCLARRGCLAEIGGHWTTQNYEVRDGEVLKIFAQRRNGRMGVKRTASLFIQMRHTGPLQELVVDLLDEADSLKSEARMAGRFDILTMEDARARGVHIPEQFEHQYDSTNVNALFGFRRLEDEIVPVAKVRTVVTQDEHTGVKKIIQTPRTRRALDLS